MRYLRLCSDVHVDFDLNHGNHFYTAALNSGVIGAKIPVEYCWLPVEMEEDSDTVLVIAGDISSDHLIIDQKYPDGECWLQKVAKRFKYVVMVLGNHDYYLRNFSTEHISIKEDIAAIGMTNVYLLENDTIVLDQVKFVGATLWTDFNKHNSLVLGAWRQMMVTDMKHIRYGKIKSYQPVYGGPAREPNIKAETIYERCVRSKKYIFKNLGRDHPDQKVFVVTHMAPSENSVSPKFKARYDDIVYGNFYFFSNFEREIEANGPDVWFHGHMHLPFDYVIGKTRVVCNPRGYPQERDTQFNPTWRIELTNT